MDISVQLSVAPLLESSSPAGVHLNFGDKVIVPTSLLPRILGESDAAARANGESNPVAIELTHRLRRTHISGGILDFTADEGRIVLPAWMAAELQARAGDAIVLRTAQLPKAETCTFEPEDAAFCSVHDYRAVLETAIGSRYVTLTKGSSIAIEHEGHHYRLRVKELQPQDMCAITNTDLEVNIITPGQTEGVQPTSTTARRIVAPNGSPVQGEASDAEYTRHSINLDGDVEYDLRCNVAVPGAGDFEAYVGPSGSGTSREKHTAPSVTDAVGSASFVISRKTVHGQSLEIAVKAFGVPLCAYTVSLTPRLDAMTTGKASTTTLPALVSPSSPSSPSPSPASDGGRVCPNCRESVPTERYALHSAYCERNNTYCGVCQRAVRRNDSGHVHCADCGMLTPTPAVAAKHAALRHVPVPCECGAILRDASHVPHHVTSECPRRMTTCRFCGNQVRAGPPASDAGDRVRGFTEHESRCGGRREDCRDCGRPVRLRDLEKHAQVHAFDRRSQSQPQQQHGPGHASPQRPAHRQPLVDDAARNAAWERAFPAAGSVGLGESARDWAGAPMDVDGPTARATPSPAPAMIASPPPETPPTARPALLCANESCGYAREAKAATEPSGAALGALCGRCASVVTGGGVGGGGSASDLLGRLIRLYYAQLTAGCGVSGCANPRCVAGGSTPLLPADAALRAVEMAREATLSPPVMYACPPPSPEGRMRAEAVRSLGEMGFPRAWCVRALDVTGNDTAAAAVWLLNNAQSIVASV